MGLYRDTDGRIYDLPDDYAQTRGLDPVSSGEETAMSQAAADAQIQQELGQARGFLGTVNAGATSFLGGLTGGLSNLALAHALPEENRKRLAAEMGEHSTVGTIGEVGGAVTGALLAPESLFAKTPTGALANLTGGIVERGLAEGGVLGTAKALGAMGAEGALQSAGSYIGHAAIDDKELTAEGISGALKMGGALGLAGGAVALGVAKGTIAARRLWSKSVDGSADAAATATSAWEEASKKITDANDANMATAQRIVDEATAASKEARAAKEKAGFNVREEQLRAKRVGPEPEAPPAPEIPTYETPEFKGAETQNLNIRPASSETRQALADMHPGASEETGNALQDIGVPAQGAPTAATSEALADIGVEAPNISKQVGKVLEAVDEFNAARKKFDALYMDPEKLWSLEPEQVMEYMSKGGNLDEFIAGQPKNTEPFAPEPQTPAWSEQDLRRYFAQKGDVAALGPQETTAVGKIKPKADTVVEDMYDAALKRAAGAQTSDEAKAALQEVAGLETKLVDVKPTQVTRIAHEAEVINDYEKAGAKLADALGDAADPVSKEAASAYRQAADDAVRKAQERTARAAEDYSTFGPVKMSSKERIQYARERQLEADQAYSGAKAKEVEAKQGFKEAKRNAAQAKKDIEAARPPAPEAPTENTTGNTLNAAGMFEMVGGIPGLKDLPVIGPLLSAYLKYRAFKTMVGKAAGRIPASGVAKAAATAAQTKERIAQAVEQMLTKAERSATVSRKAIPAAMGVLSERIFDDGSPELPKGASDQEKAAQRIRELGAYVTTPGAIENDVRREMRDVADPDLILATEKHRSALFKLIYERAPKIPPQGMFDGPSNWVPSPAEALRFGRMMIAAKDPAAVFEAARTGTLTPEMAEVFRQGFPKLFLLGQEQAMRQSMTLKTKVPYGMQSQISLLWGTPVAPSLEPDNIRTVQSVYVPVASSPPAGAPSSPAPSLSPLFQTTADRSALKR